MAMPVIKLGAAMAKKTKSTRKLMSATSSEELVSL